MNTPKNRSAFKPQTFAFPGGQVSGLYVWYILALAIAAIHAAFFYHFTIDDAYITFTYARNIVRGFGPVFNPGERVEATSSFLWAALLVPFQWLLKDGAIVGAKVLGALCIPLTGLIGCRLIREVNPPSRPVELQRVAFCLLLAASSTFILWSFYGMENGLVALLLTTSAYLFLKEHREQIGVTSAFFVFTLETVRPEGFIYVAVFIFFRLLFWATAGNTLTRAWAFRWCILLFGLLVPYEVFGLLYYGHLLPITVSAKVDGVSFGRLISGVRYLAHGSALLYSAMTIFATGLSGIVLVKNYKGWKSLIQEHPILVIIGLVLGHLSFVAFVGGDMWSNGRFISHFVPLFCVVFLYSVACLAEEFRPLRALSTKAWVSLGVLGFAAYFAVNTCVAISAYHTASELETSENRAIKGMTMALNERSVNANTVVSCSDVGRVGYYFVGKVIDWWGLTDEEIAMTGQSFGRLDPQIVLKRKPDYIVLYSTQPQLSPDSVGFGMAKYSKPFLRDPDFLKNYVYVRSFLFTKDRWHVLFERKTPSGGKVSLQAGDPFIADVAP